MHSGTSSKSSESSRPELTVPTEKLRQGLRRLAEIFTALRCYKFHPASDTSPPCFQAITCLLVSSARVHSNLQRQSHAVCSSSLVPPTLLTYPKATSFVMIAYGAPYKPPSRVFHNINVQFATNSTPQVIFSSLNLSVSQRSLI